MSYGRTRLPWLPGERSHERPVTHTEESEDLAAAPLMLRQFATVMLDTAMRPEEVCRIALATCTP